jgi:hypothetical protein
MQKFFHNNPPSKMFPALRDLQPRLELPPCSTAGYAVQVLRPNHTSHLKIAAVVVHTDANGAETMWLVFEHPALPSARIRKGVGNLQVYRYRTLCMVLAKNLLPSLWRQARTGGLKLRPERTAGNVTALCVCLQENVSMCVGRVYICLYKYIFIYVCMYIYIYVGV